MNKEYKIVAAAEVKQQRRTSPMTLLAEDAKQQGDFWTNKDIAAHIGVHVETIKRACRAKDESNNPLVNAPSRAVQQGRAVVWLYTKDDVREIESYFEDRGFSIPRPIDMKKTLKEQTPSEDSRED